VGIPHSQRCRQGPNSGDQRQLQVNIGKGVQHIPANIFNKDDISKVVFEEGSICETIDDYAFDNSSITYIILPKSIKTIGSYALGDICIEIYYLGNEIEWEEVEKTAADYEDITIYYYIEDESNLPQDNGNYWHYDIDRKTPIIWQGIE